MSSAVNKKLSECAAFRADAVNLQVVDGAWDYALQNGHAIESHWLKASAANPGYFNGVVHLIAHLEIDEGSVRAELIRTNFKSFLYWRDAGFPDDAAVLDGFGSALLRSHEGHVLLGRQQPGNINAGLSYLPGGFIDARDVDPNGMIDIKASIARELLEETGLGLGDFEAEPGYIVTRSGRQVSFAAGFRSPLTADRLMSKIHDHLAAEADPELASMVIVRSEGDMRGLAMPPYARLLLERLFQGL
jgi:8-oxo-dGTP pyrophosphatase MutT (NUDIX family)